MLIVALHLQIQFHYATTCEKSDIINEPGLTGFYESKRS